MKIDNWTTHIPVLNEILINKYKNSIFLELGTGYGSTPLIINNTKMSLHLETNEDWYKQMKKFEILPYHEIKLFQDYSSYEWICDYFNKQWDVCLIDNAPGESRQSNLMKLKNNCKIIICHDTEEILSKAYNYGWDFSSFKYVFTYINYDVTTTVCSDEIFFDMNN